MQIRDAEDRDLEGITTIYNDAVEQTTAIWNETTIDVENRRAWLVDRRNAGYPVLVTVSDEDKVLGYASFGDWRAWDGYRYTVEHSVYVRSDQRGAGIGKALMEALIGRARRHWQTCDGRGHRGRKYRLDPPAPEARLRTGGPHTAGRHEVRPLARFGLSAAHAR